MKVSLAAQVLSHSVSAAALALVARNLYGPSLNVSSVQATSVFCSKFNDFFDILNSSSSKDTCKLRRPFRLTPETEQYIDESISWLKTLRQENKDRPCLLYTSPSPRDKRQSRMPSSA